MVVRTSRRFAATLVRACLVWLALSACSDVRHVVGKTDLSASGGSTAPVSGSGASSSGTGGIGGDGSGGLPLGGAFVPFDASLPDAMPECTPFEAAEPRRLNLYLVVDRTVAQGVFVVWGAMVEGIQRYAEMPEAEGTGLGYDLIGVPLTFPGVGSGDTCNSSDYDTPVVGIQRDPLPAHIGEIQSHLEGVEPSLNSELLPAMTGAVSYASSVRDSYKEHLAIVLITDSLVDADQCGTTIASVARVAAAARAAGTPTYVIENVVPLFGELPVIDEFLAQLEPIAEAGGTTARKLGVLADLTTLTDLAAMLLEIQRIETPRCQYALPNGYTWEQLQLALQDPSGPRPFPRLDSDGECAGDGGVYLDTATGFARACANTCDAILASGAPIWVTDCESGTPTE